MIQHVSKSEGLSKKYAVLANGTSKDLISRRTEVQVKNDSARSNTAVNVGMPRRRHRSHSETNNQPDRSFCSTTVTASSKTTDRSLPHQTRMTVTAETARTCADHRESTLRSKLNRPHSDYNRTLTSETARSCRYQTTMAVAAETDKHKSDQEGWTSATDVGRSHCTETGITVSGKSRAVQTTAVVTVESKTRACSDKTRTLVACDVRSKTRTAQARRTSESSNACGQSLPRVPCHDDIVPVPSRCQTLRSSSVEVHSEPKDLHNSHRARCCSMDHDFSDDSCVEPQPYSNSRSSSRDYCVADRSDSQSQNEHQMRTEARCQSRSMHASVTSSPKSDISCAEEGPIVHPTERSKNSKWVTARQRLVRVELSPRAYRHRSNSVKCPSSPPSGPAQAAEELPDPPIQLSPRSKKCVTIATSPPTIRLSRASSRRHSGRSAKALMTSPSPSPNHRWKDLVEVMKRYREDQQTDHTVGLCGVEDDKEDSDRLVKVVFGNACYLLPVKHDLPEREEHLFDVSDLQHEPPLISKCGSLEVTFTYDSTKAKMEVHIHRAREIPAKERGGANSTQVRVMLLPAKKQHFKTKVKDGQDPTYDEAFIFNKVASDEALGMGLRFRLYGLERMRRERMIGESIIGFASLNLLEPSTHWVILEPRSNLSHCDFGFDVSSLSRSNSASSSQSLQHGGMPELLVGLAYNGTTGRLAVQVIKGSNFRNMATNRAPDTYVKVTLMSPSGQELQRCKTSVRRGQPNPLFKETFMLQVALFQLPDVTLMVSVYTKRSMKKKEMIGWFSLGQNSSGDEERSHWTDMRESKGDEVCRWHALLES